MRRFQIITAVLLQTFSQGVVAGWTPDWSAGFGPETCSLIRPYYDVGETSKVILSNSGNSKVIGVVFLAFSEITSDSDIIGIPVAAGEFVLSVTTKIREPYVGRAARVSGVAVDGTFLSEVAVGDGRIETIYLLRTNRARQVFESFKKGDSIPIKFQLVGGESGALEYPADPERRFVVWSAMLEACRLANAT